MELVLQCTLIAVAFALVLIGAQKPSEAKVKDGVIDYPRNATSGMVAPINQEISA